MIPNTPKILGVDFDETLFLKSFPNNYTQPNWPVINYVKRRKKEGWYIILVTCRTDETILKNAIKACKRVGIQFDAVNENHPALIAYYGNSRKISCDEYIDDKNITIESILKTNHTSK